MSGYPINLSNGTLITTVNPGTFDTTTFNIALLGRGVANYGEITAENFVHLLENFASPQAPGSNPNLSGSPTTGQLWYDTNEKVLKVYDSTTTSPWRPLLTVNNNGSVTFTNGTPANPSITFTNNTSTGLYLLPSPNNGIGISVGGNNILNITTQGTGFPDGSNTNPSIYFTADSDTGIFRPGNGQIGFTSNGNTRFVINTSGGTFYGNYTLGPGSTLQATYADLAERYHSDEVLSPGTVVCLGGEKEITQSRKEYDTEVFGVIAEFPAFGMNQNAGDNETHPYVALAGRVKVKVVGPVVKGQRLVTSKLPGTAQAAPSWVTDWRMIIGRALQTKEDSGTGFVEIVVGAK
jgi:hypothetical protein